MSISLFDDHQGVVGVAERCTLIKKLNLIDACNHKIVDADITSIAGNLRHSLETIELKRCNELTSLSLSALAHCKKLFRYSKFPRVFTFISLNLDRCRQLTTDGIQELCSSIGHQLITLNLR